MPAVTLKNLPQLHKWGYIVNVPCSAVGFETIERMSDTMILPATSYLFIYLLCQLLQDKKRHKKLKEIIQS